MTGVRIRWAAVGRVAAIAVAGLALLQILPGLLRTPAPPPLAADVGLPRVAVPRVAAAKPKPKPRHRRKRLLPALAPGVISSAPRRHRARPHPSKPPPRSGVPAAAGAVDRPPPSPPASVVEPPPASAPEPPPASAPEPPPAPRSEAPPAPNDGSLEFAPR